VAHYLLSAEATFAAAHTLPGVAKCERMHGHNWRVRLTVRVEAAALDEGGMAVDFRVVEDAVRAAVSEFDHAYLNDLEPFGDNPPTAERLAEVVCQRTSEQLGAAAPGARVDAVEIWETPQYRVEYRP
jgi:6-pyruvoyltetrahydropterin/6-carboxytetrahydropterin synthase